MNEWEEAIQAIWSLRENAGLERWVWLGPKRGFTRSRSLTRTLVWVAAQHLLWSPCNWLLTSSTRDVLKGACSTFQLKTKHAKITPYRQSA